jgi:DNA-binding MarR family transcriptional regulator
VEEFSDEESMRTKGSRDEAMYTTYAEYGYPLKEIAEYLGVHYATVSRALRCMERQR